ncbi:hypothetical protein SALBM311S_12310 [Streptomyces alboniger]
MDIELWVTQIRAASFTLTYEVKDPDQVYVTGLDGDSSRSTSRRSRPRRINRGEEREFLERE